MAHGPLDEDAGLETPTVLPIALVVNRVPRIALQACGKEREMEHQ